MQLLLLTDADSVTATQILPGLELLAHEIRTSPLAVKLPASAAARFDLVLVDGTGDLRGARSCCIDLSHDCAVPRLLIVNEASLPGVTPEWGLADMLLPAASPAEIDVRLRLAYATSGSVGLQNSSGDNTLSVDSNGGTNTNGAVNVAGVVINENNFTARVQDRTLDLTYKEFELLHFLASNLDRVFTREQLLSEVWGTDYYGGTRTVDVHVRRLRAKLGDHESLISTVRGVGYGFARNALTESYEG